MANNSKLIDKKLRTNSGQDWDTFLALRAGAQRGVYLDLAILEMLFDKKKKAYDHTTALMLSQILYWYLPDRNGVTKLRVFKKGHEWLVKRRTDWLDEPIRLSDEQAKRSLAVLKKKKLIITAVHRFNNKPTTHIRLNTDLFLPAYFEASTRLFCVSRPKTEMGLETQNINRDSGTETDKEKGRSDEQLPCDDPHFSSLGKKVLAPAKSNVKQKAVVSKRLANIELINYFLNKWEEQFGESHTRLGSEQLQYIDTVFSDSEVGRDMIDAYFKKEYQHGCDYRIMHFCSAGVLQNLVFEMRY